MPEAQCRSYGIMTFIFLQYCIALWKHIYPRVYIDNVKAFVSSEECKSAVMPRYPEAMIGAVEAVMQVNMHAAIR